MVLTVSEWLEVPSSSRSGSSLCRKRHVSMILILLYDIVEDCLTRIMVFWPPLFAHLTKENES